LDYKGILGYFREEPQLAQCEQLGCAIRQLEDSCANLIFRWLKLNDQRSMQEVQPDFLCGWHSYDPDTNRTDNDMVVFFDTNQARICKRDKHVLCTFLFLGDAFFALTPFRCLKIGMQGMPEAGMGSTELQEILQCFRLSGNTRE
jgi:hypothetical protein